MHQNLESIIFPLAYEKLTEHASVRQQQACLVQYFIDAVRFIVVVLSITPFRSY